MIVGVPVIWTSEDLAISDSAIHPVCGIDTYLKNDVRNRESPALVVAWRRVIYNFSNCGTKVRGANQVNRILIALTLGRTFWPREDHLVEIHRH